MRAVLFWCLALVSCAGTLTPRDASIIDISFEVDGRFLNMSQLQGQPSILVLMRTSEVVSQIYMSRLKDAYLSLQGQMPFVVLTIESSEAPFVKNYVAFEQLPFPIGVAEEAVIQGDSALGVVPGVPITYFIDSDGSVVDVILGVIEKDVLMRKLANL